MDSNDWTSHNGTGISNACLGLCEKAHGPSHVRTISFPACINTPCIVMPSQGNAPSNEQPASYVKKQQYAFGKTIGKGTYSVVRSATRTLPDHTTQPVAVKIIKKDQLKQREHLIMQEIEMVRSLNHPHIIKLIDWFESKDKFYLVFEEAHGGELFYRLMQGRFTERAACRIIYVVLEAIVYMHRNGIVHRDIKPENILYRSEAQDADIVLVDFGIATHLYEHTDTELHGMCGSVGYAAPEVMARKGYGKPVDMWGLGVVTYCMLCGFAPFSSVDPKLFLEQVESATISFEGKYWDSVSAEGIDFVQQCLNRDPEQRITSEDALHHAWFRLISNEMHESDDDGNDISAGVRENYRSKWKSVMATVRATKRIQALSNTHVEPLLEDSPTSPLYSDDDDDNNDDKHVPNVPQRAPSSSWLEWLRSYLPVYNYSE